MARILLIKSRNLDRIQSGATPPLGIMYLASYIREKRHDEVMIKDLLFIDDLDNELVRIISQFNPSIVGISAIANEAENLHKIASIVKVYNPKIKVIIGGPYLSSFKSEAMADENIDIGVIGEGEETFIELLNKIENDTADLSSVNGIIYQDDNKIIATQQRPYIYDLDMLPYPAYDLIDINAYKRFKGESTARLGKYTVVLTSRGCPFHCIYCHNMFGKRFRARSVENVISEIEMLVRNYEIRHFEIIDDIANFDKERFKSLLTHIINKNWGIKLSFPNGVRTDLLDEEAIDLMKEAGTEELSIAIETASPRLQKTIKKNLNLKKVQQIIERAVYDGMFVRGFFMLGFPTETEDELKTTLNFAIHSKLHLALFLIVIPFKGTELYEQIPYNGIFDKPIDADYYTMPFNLSNVPDRIFFKLYRYAYIKFYLDPKRIIRILMAKPSLRDRPGLGFRVLKYMLIKPKKKL
jgi:radical SAM superfamily enzyme YgiQ (UPF0313 family)